MPIIWGASRSLPARFEVTRSEALYARFEVGQDSADLLARAEVGQDSRDLLVKFELQGAQDLLCRFEAQATTDLLGRFGVNQDAEDLLGKFEAQTTVNLFGKVNITHSIDLFGRFETQAIANLLGKANITHSIDLFGKGVIRNIDSTELLGKGEIQHSGSAELLGKFEAQTIEDLPARFEIGQDSRELFGKADIRHDGAVDLPARFEVQVTLDLLARFEVGQDSRDLLALAEVGQDSADLLSKAVIIHPAYPVWLFGKFEVGLTNDYLDLGSILKIGRFSSSDLLGKADIQHSAFAEAYGYGVIRHIGSAEAYGHLVVKNVGTRNLPCSVAIQSLGDLYAKFSVGLWDSVMPIFDDNLIFHLTYVAEIGQGFIGSPVIEMDESEKMMGKDSFKITSSYEAGGCKAVGFGWRYGLGLWPPAFAYFNMIGDIWLQEVGGYHKSGPGSVIFYVDDPVGWGGWYWNRV